MTLVIFIFILLLIAFLIGSGLIVRHEIKFGYLAPKFKIVVIIFGTLSLTIIIVAIYLLTLTGSSAPSTSYESYDEPYSNSSNEFSF